MRLKGFRFGFDRASDQRDTSPRPTQLPERGHWPRQAWYQHLTYTDLIPPSTRLLLALPILPRPLMPTLPLLLPRAGVLPWPITKSVS